MTLGQRIAFYRKKQALTQGQLGEQLNISAQAISKWENDQAQPDVSTLIQLAKVFDISLELLLTGEETATHSAPAYAAANEPNAPQKQKKPSAVKKLFRKIGSFLNRFKKLLISLLCAVLAITIFFIVANYTFLQSCSKFNFNRVEPGMSMEKVEKLLGAPHKKVVSKTIGGYDYDDDGSLGNAFTEGFMEGLTGESVKVTGATYYYYDGVYGRTLERLNKLNEKYENLSINASLSKIERLENKIIKLEEKLESIDSNGVMKITFKNDEVTEVYIKTDAFKQTKR
ncbi:MAG: helix-turn-helix transcriptional regulator [Clostridia bacterium]|nr:helix-turn-helix transcriptional regulator [Clostridia bacterium]